MNKNAPTKERGLEIALKLKRRCQAAGIPVEQVYLFGSLASGKAGRQSDVDIAVVYEPFEKQRTPERRRIRALREDFDVPMDIVCLRMEDLENDLWGVAQEVRQSGIPV